MPRNIAVLIALTLPCSTPQAATQEPSPSDLGAAIAQVTDIRYPPAISPNGDWVVYPVTRRSLETNTVTTEWRLQRIHSAGQAVRPYTRLPSGAKAIRWHPDGQRVSFMIESRADDEKRTGTLTFYDATTGSMKPVGLSRSAHVEPNEDYKWSPDGNHVAFILTVDGEPPEGGLRKDRGTPYAEWRKGSGIKSPKRRLFVLEARTGLARQVNPDNYEVSRIGGFEWSPDSRQLMVTIDRDPDSQGADTDLVLIDCATGKVREFVVRPGRDAEPVWSPDGRWIAFNTLHGVPDYRNGWPAFASVESAEVLKFSGAQKSGAAHWAADSRNLYVQVNVDMTTRLVRADLNARSITEPLPLAPGGPPLPYDFSYSFSSDARRVVFVRSGPTTPPELFVADLDKRGRPKGPARQLTDLNPEFPLSDLVRAESITWPSTDGRFSVQGLLLTPPSGDDDGKLDGPLPTILNLHGGPAMVGRGFSIDGWNATMRLLLAVRGYAVLSPNTRGRNGQGDEFQAGIADGKSSARLPLEDAVAGIDLLVARGVADHGRLGVIGHSYGGFLAAYATTQTDRFKAAVLHESVGLDNTYGIHWTEKGTWRELLARDLMGLHDPFDPTEQKRLHEESPLLNVNRVKTPTLLSCGAHSAAERECRPMFKALQRFNIPSAFFVYDEGHVYERPAAVADDITRTIEWLDYWVRGIPYPDAARAKEYDAWNTAGAAVTGGNTTAPRRP